MPGVHWNRKSIAKALASAALSGAALSAVAEAADAPGSAPAAPAAITPTHLDLWEIDVEGNSVLDDALIYRTIEPFLGPQRPLEDVDRAREALEGIYRERGYKTVAVTIPRQTAREGVVRLEVVEGRIGHLNVVGSRYHSIEQIKTEVPSLAEGTVPDFNEVQKDIVAVNGQADRKVTPALKAGSRPGTIDVDLAVDDKLPLHGSVEVNNHRSQDTSELRVAGTLSYDNLWQLGHSFTASYQTAPYDQSDTRVLFASYLVRFGASPFSLLLNGIVSNSNVATIGGIQALGKGETAVVRGFYALPGTDSFFPSLYFGAAYKHFRSSTVLGGQGFTTPVTYYPFTLGLSFALREPNAVTQADLSLNFASPQLGSTGADLHQNRLYARGQQFYFKENLSRVAALPYDMQWVVRVAAQRSDEPLISTEQFSAGGAESVRGYLESETLGDYGFSGSLELRAPSLAPLLAFGAEHSWFDEVRFFSFVDGARLKLRQPQVDQTPEFDLLSAGIGLNLKLLSSIEGVFNWAEPFYDGPRTRKYHSRLLFKVAGSF
jgi:hemolysin activation/secretion protein